jgi:hypothetical protein
MSPDQQDDADDLIGFGYHGSLFWSALENAFTSPATLGSIRASQCAFCRDEIDLDPDFDLYTTFNSEVVCLNCAAVRAPEHAEFARRFRAARDEGRAEVVSHEEIDNDSTGYSGIHPIAVIHEADGSTTTRELK